VGVAEGKLFTVDWGKTTGWLDGLIRKNIEDMAAMAAIKKAHGMFSDYTRGSAFRQRVGAGTDYFRFWGNLLSCLLLFL